MAFVIVKLTNGLFVRKEHRTLGKLYDRWTPSIDDAEVFERESDADFARIIDEQEVVRPLSDYLNRV